MFNWGPDTKHGFVIRIFWGIFCVSYFVTTVTKIHDRNTLREGTLALPHGFREISVIMVRKAREKEPVAVVVPEKEAEGVGRS